MMSNSYSKYHFLLSVSIMLILVVSCRKTDVPAPCSCVVELDHRGEAVSVMESSNRCSGVSDCEDGIDADILGVDNDVVGGDDDEDDDGGGKVVGEVVEDEDVVGGIVGGVVGGVVGE